MAEYKFAHHPYPVIIQFVPNEKAWDRIIGRMGLDEPYPESDGRCTVFGHKRLGSRILITFSEKADARSSTDVIGLMVHELTHVVQQIAKIVGETADCETEAYMMQSLITWLIESYTASGRTFKDGG